MIFCFIGSAWYYAWIFIKMNTRNNTRKTNNIRFFSIFWESALLAHPDCWKYWKKLFWKTIQKWIHKLIRINIIEMSLKINISCDMWRNTLIFFYKQLALEQQIAKQLSMPNHFSLSNNKKYRLRKNGLFPL